MTTQSTNPPFPAGARIRSLVTGRQATSLGGHKAELDNGKVIDTKDAPNIPTWEIGSR